MSIARVMRIGAAIAILVGGLVHLHLYFDGYRDIPDIGRSFMLNAIASGAIAAALAARRDWFIRLAGIGLAVGTIVAFILSRQGDGLFDFRERGLNPSPQAALALFVEITAIVLIGLTFVPAIAGQDADFGLPVLGAAVVVALVAMIGFGAVAASDDGSPAAGGPAAVAIAGFSFKDKELTVANGSTVTWTNEDGVGHSVNAVDDTFNSERLSEGDTFDFEFATAGEFAYRCDIHPYMEGTIIVSG